MFRTVCACAVLLLASKAEADVCSFNLVRSTLGEVTNLYLEQQASDKAIDAANEPQQFLIVIPRGLAATARRAVTRHQIATTECSSDATDIAGLVAKWFEGYGRLYTDKADVGRRLLLGEIDFDRFKVLLAENVASLDEHWKNLPQLVVAVSYAIVGSDPARADGTALRLTEEERKQLLSEIDSDCGKLGGCSRESQKGGGVPAAIVVQRLMGEHLRKPWALNGTALR
jgi:hypothetical protein